MLKLISLNCEGDRHLSQIAPFLEKKRPDVFCAQEVFEADLPMLEQAVGGTAHFVPLLTLSRPNPHNIAPRGNWGIALFVSNALMERDYQAEYYVRHGAETPTHIVEPNDIDRAVQWVTVQKDGTEFVIANTHFTWSMNGEASNEQQQSLNALFGVLQQIPQFILCGDFNAPRGRKTFSRLAEKYTDNIPTSIISTLDSQLHRAKGVQYMVDGMFSTSAYRVEHVHVIDGLSDHKAIAGEISPL